jgi:DNA-binding transcriptional MerR regulator
MSSRSYLSIGDVLTLLREEFPDVTISKIRFLESQGLVNPERSPSGYRKFFDHDVERLRWVLRQQREHFLPLKVIRDRLAGGVDEDEVHEVDEGQAAHTNGRVTPVPAGVGAGVAGHAQPVAGATAVARPGGNGGDDDTMARILADATRRAARAPLHAVSDEAGRAATQAPHSPPAVTDVPVSTANPAIGEAAAVRAEPRGEAPSASPATAVAATDPVTASAAASRSSGAARGAGTPQGASGPKRGTAGGSARGADDAQSGDTDRRARGRQGEVTSAVVTGASLTADELCAACGLSEVELAALQGFGLVESINVAGIATFDEDALIVAQLAAQFRKFGIEPRHLRLYRNAVDREMGLIEQVIIPLLRQRNPESRQRAVEAADELGVLGQSMRSALVRAALRRHVGG